MPDLREEIALGRQTRLATKLRMVIGYTVHIVRAVRAENFSNAAIITSKLGAILRCWEAKQKADQFACLKSSSADATQ